MPPSIPEPLELDTFPGIKQCAARRSSGARWREGFEGSTPNRGHREEFTKKITYHRAPIYMDRDRRSLPRARIHTDYSRSSTYCAVSMHAPRVGSLSGRCTCISARHAPVAPRPRPLPCPVTKVCSGPCPTIWARDAPYEVFRARRPMQPACACACPCPVHVKKERKEEGRGRKEEAVSS